MTLCKVVKPYVSDFVVRFVDADTSAQTRNNHRIRICMMHADA